MQEIIVDLPDSLWLQHHFTHYANPKAVIARLARNGVLYRIQSAQSLILNLSNSPRKH